MPPFDNIAIAATFEVMADLLEIQDADKFRFLSYRKAANSLRAWPEDVARTAGEGRLTEIPGVGPKLARAIGEILETGTFGEYEEAKAALPESLGRLTAVPGVGPKKARVLHDELGVRSVDDLERVALAGELDKLRGFGKKSVETIRAGIETYRRHQRGVLLSEALPMAESMAELLAHVPGVERVEPSGEVRRRTEMVGTIDLVVGATEAAVVTDAASRMPYVTRVLEKGIGAVRLAVTAGVELDIRVVAPERFGAAWLQRTGSPEHVRAVRERAERLGVDLDGVDAGSEDEVYALLGMRTPPPELREDCGEIEAAVEGRLPALLEPADIRGDLHAHTTSTDAKSTLEENRAAAAALGYEYIGVTDHAERLKMVRGLTIDQLERQWEHVDELNAARAPGDPVILKGTELNIAEDGSVDYPDEVLARFDYCIASLHSGWSGDRAAATGRVLRAIENPFVDIIGHPTGRILGRRDPIELDMEAVLAAAGETGTAMEINAYPDRLDLKDEHVRLAKRYGVRFSIGTDAHHARHLGYMRYGVWTARRGWAEAADVLNTLSLPDLTARLSRARRR